MFDNSVIINTRAGTDVKKYICSGCRADLIKVHPQDPTSFDYKCPYCGLTYNPKVEDVRMKSKLDRVESPFGGVTKPEAGQLEQIIYIENNPKPEFTTAHSINDDPRVAQNMKNYGKMMNAKLIKYHDDKVSVQG